MQFFQYSKYFLRLLLPSLLSKNICNSMISERARQKKTKRTAEVSTFEWFMLKIFKSLFTMLCFGREKRSIFFWNEVPMCKTECSQIVFVDLSASENMHE